jgi:hypothetical protein
MAEIILQQSTRYSLADQTVQTVITCFETLFPGCISVQHNALAILSNTPFANQALQQLITRLPSDSTLSA